MRGVQSCAVRALLSALSSQSFSKELLDAGLLPKVQVWCISPQLLTLAIDHLTPIYIVMTSSTWKRRYGLQQLCCASSLEHPTGNF